ncbi:futalosine hydrolase [Polymorphospora rubra]|uniref:futalosine hydrolase n=1 Tax=Polymorphospora rubra TaxID=338584 RepID=UPI003F4D2E1F
MIAGRLLVVTAVEAEAAAVRAGLREPTVTVTPVGVGPAAAAAGTARLLALAEGAGQPYAAVVCAGIAGGFTDRVEVGGTVLADRSIAADLGAESPDGFIPLDELGFGETVAQVHPPLLATLRRALPAAAVGAVLTVGTVTGSAESAKALAVRHPDAVAEAMEGYGVACAAAGAGVPFAELRTVSNPIGPRDRAAWRMREAFDALTAAAATLA